MLDDNQKDPAQSLRKAPATRVWDAPTRLFHWLLVTSFAVAWFTYDARYLDIHVFVGYLMGVLILFRLIWGFVGTRWARFGSFLYSPFAALRYLRKLAVREPPPYLGHNPAGSWAIYMLLLLAALIVVSGILTLGGEKWHGPLARMLSFAQGDLAHSVHKLLSWTMLVVAIGHVSGVIVSSIVERENLAKSMVTGYKHAPDSTPAVSSFRALAVVLGLAVVVAGFLYTLDYWRPGAPKPYLPFVGVVLPTDPMWTEECSGCHLAYHPTLLPSRSWKKMMEEQADHFGEDLALDESKTRAITDFGVANAAESAQSPLAWKFNSTTPAGMIPLRVTETPFWIEQHEDMDSDAWKITKKHDCGACHLDAERGTFQPGAIEIPAKKESQASST